MLDLSVVVPTHNRIDYLPALLSSLAGQDYPPDRWELIIVDDGSSDGTRRFVECYSGPRPANMRLLSQAQSGVAVARNNGASVARGRAVLFLDDDMIASPRLVREHALVHAQDPCAVVIGHVSLPVEGRDPWVAWEDDKLHRHFQALRSGTRTPGPRDFYTGNCSVSTTLFRSIGGFDASLPRTEDVEIGYRCRNAGANFYYRADADSLHLGRHSFEGWLRNARLYGRCDVTLAWEKGHAELQHKIFGWFLSRQALIRALVSACSGRPALEAPTVRLLDRVGRGLHAVGVRKVSNACYSAIYNLVYWLALIEALGKERFWAGVQATKVDRARSGGHPPGYGVASSPPASPRILTPASEPMRPATHAHEHTAMPMRPPPPAPPTSPITEGQRP
jgi:glycosyltransferase involved in cell wall biosynthesis